MDYYGLCVTFRPIVAIFLPLINLVLGIMGYAAINLPTCDDLLS